MFLTVYLCYKRTHIYSYQNLYMYMQTMCICAHVLMSGIYIFISLIFFLIGLSFLISFRDLCCHSRTEKAQQSRLKWYMYMNMYTLVYILVLCDSLEKYAHHLHAGNPKAESICLYTHIYSIYLVIGKYNIYS